MWLKWNPCCLESRLWTSLGREFVTAASLLQGKGVMNTYWLVDKEGGVGNGNSSPTLTPAQTSEPPDLVPEFINLLLGSLDDDLVPDLD